MTLEQVQPGAYTAIVTPRQVDYSIDFDKLKEVVTQQISAGITGIIVMGTTGEGDYIGEFKAGASDSEQFGQYVSMIAHAVKQRDTLKSSTPIIAGIKGQQAGEAKLRATLAFAYQADAGLLVTPAYAKPRQNGLIHFYEEVAQNTSLPLILYDVPSRTGVSLEPETIFHLAANNPTLIGLKAATSDMGRMRAYVQAAQRANETREHPFHVLSGDDATTYNAIKVGAQGGIAVVSNIIPQDWGEMVGLALGLRPWDKGHLLSRDEAAAGFAEKWKPLCDATMAYGNPMSTKAILGIIGRGVGPVHPQLGQLEPAEIADLEQRLKPYSHLKSKD